MSQDRWHPKGRREDFVQGENSQQQQCRWARNARVVVCVSWPAVLVERWASAPLCFIREWQSSEEAQAPLEKLMEREKAYGLAKAKKRFRVDLVSLYRRLGEGRMLIGWRDGAERGGFVVQVASLLFLKHISWGGGLEGTSLNGE